MHLFKDPAVEAQFASFPSAHQAHLLRLRELILGAGSRCDLPCEIDETLKWNEPSYLPVKPRVGTTVRLGSFDDERVGLYFSCQTTLVMSMRETYGDSLTYSKNRALLFQVSEQLPEAPIEACVRMALRYHLDKKRRP